MGMILITILALFSKVLGAQKDLSNIGMNASIWAMIFGFILANTFFWNHEKLPNWIGSIQKFQEYYIKLGN